MKIIDYYKMPAEERVKFDNAFVAALVHHNREKILIIYATVSGINIILRGDPIQSTDFFPKGGVMWPPEQVEFHNKVGPN